ncbi:hypothetical protein OTK49_00310 [Vibrio coralliirubri]|uniref:hypothetical protein n=1 Tax=Vibrio coralliirubri TaxID=1516159 RepID=UPI0022848DBB|nr:hypothetical protein [Vibrio coralliirubri]MCY9860983.1 hypothetical protein [Vibrio coralliirubri]
MLIKKTTQADFDSQQQARAMRGFASTLASKICAITRGNLSIPMIQAGEISVASHAAKEYIEKISPSIKYKIGVQFDESSFIAIGIDSNFVSKSSYYWAGGRLDAPVKTINSNLTGCEAAFLKSFIELIQPMIQEELNNCAYVKVEISAFDDNGIAFKNEQRVQINTVNCAFKDEEVSLSIITSDGVLNYCNLKNAGETEIKLKDTRNLLELNTELEACFEPFQLTMGDILNLEVGQSFIMNDNAVSLINPLDKSVIKKGILGSGDQNNQLVKII